MCIFLDFFYSFFAFYILYRLFCYLFISLFYAGPMLIAVFITEMVILHKYVVIIIIIIIININIKVIKETKKMTFKTLQYTFYYWGIKCPSMNITTI